MTLIRVFVRRLEPDGTHTLVSIQRPWLVGAPDRPHQDEEEPTLTDRVFQFLDKRSA